MLPHEMVEAAGYLHKAFDIVSRIMLSIYAETDMHKNVDKDILRVRKATLRYTRTPFKKRDIQRSLLRRKPARRLSKFASFVKANLRRLRRKHYALRYSEVFKIMVEEWQEAKKSAPQRERK